MGETDVGRLIGRARERARLSREQLAEAAGTSRSAISRYERGEQSPTVRALDRLLAACGLQARVLLEPLMADLDARVDLLEGGALPEIEARGWGVLIASLDDQPGARDAYRGKAERRGPVTWAVDGATALVLHGLAAEPGGLEAMDLVVRLDDAARFWMRAVNLRGVTADDRLVQDWLDSGSDRIVGALGGEAVRWCALGFVRVRVLTEEKTWPATLLVTAPWSAEPVPVVTVEEVERSNPVYSELLARWRARREVS